MLPVSVIIPFYNRETTLLDSISSVLRQTYSSFELILVDDASTDKSIEVVEKIQDPRLRIIRHQKNSGAAAARNTGIREARYPLIAFLDSDDIWHQGKLEKHIPFHLSIGAAASCTSFMLVRKNGTSSIRHLPEDHHWQRAFHYGCHVSPGSTMIVNRDVFDRIGYLDENLKRLEDWDWLLRLVKQEKFAALDEILSDVRLDGFPSDKVVESAIAKIIEKHPCSIFQSQEMYKTFRSSAEIECAYASFHNEKYARLIQHLLKAFYHSPGAFLCSMKRIIKGRS